MSADIFDPPSSLSVVVAAALVDTDRRVLVQQRPPGSDFGGLWEFPGGKIEAGENPEGALVRELAEELGIIVDPKSLAPACFASEPLGDRHLLLLVFVCRHWRGSPRLIQATGLRWLRPSALYTLDMPPADRPLIGLLDALL